MIVFILLHNICKDDFVDIDIALGFLVLPVFAGGTKVRDVCITCANSLGEDGANLAQTTFLLDFIYTRPWRGT